MFRYPLWLKAIGALIVMSLLFVTHGGAVTVTLEASQDNTLYEDAAGLVSNGVGFFLFVGQTRTGTGSERRGLVQFDIASAIPVGSTVNSVQLRLVTLTPMPHTSTVSVHRVLAPWGEGRSHASGAEGKGGDAKLGDATWLHAFFDASFWVRPGGDFEPVESASLVATGRGPQIWESTPELVADVQHWSDFPSRNFGWLLQVPNATSASAVRFHTRESSAPTQMPLLTVEFTPPPVLITPRSGPFVTGQMIDIVLLVQVPAETITKRVIFLDGIDVSMTFGPCFDAITGVFADEGQTFRCTGAEAAMAFEAGRHHFKVVLEHVDGSSSEDSVSWVVWESTEP